MKNHLSVRVRVWRRSCLRFGWRWDSLPFPRSSRRPVFSSDAAAERIPNLDTLKTEVRQYHDCTCKCGCYAHDLDAQADRAIEFLHRLAARRRPNEKLALILDIDDTTLSTYPEMVGADFAYNRPATIVAC